MLTMGRLQVYVCMYLFFVDSKCSSITEPHNCTTKVDTNTKYMWWAPDNNTCVNDDLSSFIDNMFSTIVFKGPNTNDVIEKLGEFTDMFQDALEDNFVYPSDLSHSVELMGTIPKKVRGFGKVEKSIVDLVEQMCVTLSTLTSEETQDVWQSFVNKATVVALSMDILNITEQMAASVLELLEASQNNVTVTEENLDFEVLFFSPHTPRSREITLSGKQESSQIIFPPELANIAQAHARPDLGGKYGYYRAQFDTLGDMFNIEDITDPEDSNSSVILASDVLSATVLGLEPDSDILSNLSSPLTIVLKHKRNDSLTIRKVSCVFLDVNKSSGIHRWSTEGCVVVHTGEDHTVCQCNHLTNFALVMDLFKLEISASHEMALSFISYIGGTMSVLGCLLSIFTYEFFRLGNERIRVHEMLASSIIFTQLIFFIGFERTENLYVCRSFALLLHFFLTALFCWMLVEGIHLYVSLVKVFRRHSNLKKYCVIGWGVPFVIVLISGIVFFNQYGGPHACWVTTKVLLIAFVPFVVLTILINLAVLILVIRVMTTSLKMAGRNEDIPAARSGLKATVTLTPLLGLTWVFGFLSVDNYNTLIFTYLFTICNSLQGVFFFVFHCLLNNDVRRAYERRYRRQSQSNSSNPPKVIPTGMVVPCKASSPARINETLTPEPDLQLSLPRKRSSAYSIDSNGTNITAVDENFNGKPRNGSFDEESDDSVWPTAVPGCRRISSSAGLGVTADDRSTDDMIKDSDIKDALEAFNSIFGSHAEEKDIYITHM